MQKDSTTSRNLRAECSANESPCITDIRNPPVMVQESGPQMESKKNSEPQLPVTRDVSRILVDEIATVRLWLQTDGARLVSKSGSRLTTTTTWKKKNLTDWFFGDREGITRLDLNSTTLSLKQRL